MRSHYKLGAGSGKKSQFTAARKRLHLHICAQGEAAPWVDHRRNRRGLDAERYVGISMDPLHFTNGKKGASHAAVGRSKD
jgi:hypothetical protein